MTHDVETTGSRLDTRVLRVAAVGDSSSAVFHLEAAAIRERMSPVVNALVSNVDDTAEPVPGCPVCSVNELAERSDIDVVFVCGPVASRIETAEVMLQNRKHVVVDASADMNPSHVQRLLQASSSAQQHCSVWRPRDAEPSFRRAARIVASREAGPIRAVRLMQHDMAAAVLPVVMSSASREQIHRSTLKELVGERISQAIRLVGRPIASVSATSSCEPITFGAGESARSVVPDGDTAMQIILRCDKGESMVLDLGMSWVAPVNTGWIVQGTQGGFCSERQYITVEDGEIYDVAVDISPFDLYQNLRDTIHGWHDVSVREECHRRLIIEQQVAEVLQQIG